MKNDESHNREIQTLQAEIEALKKENARLRSRLAKLEHQETTQKDASADAASSDLTPQEKIRLFRSLFKGREDVYAVHWISRKDGRTGYSPARLRGKEDPDSGEPSCLPLTDQVIFDHLVGKQTVGLYPLLEDEICWLLAVDFDKTTWLEDAAAFRSVAQVAGVPLLLERSRSGNGAHAWIFFSEPVPATLARQLGSGLLTQTLNDRYQLGLSSYDRLFPSQDTLPKGGFGNLIALPLQGKSRKLGNTVFLNESLRPHEDQWRCLASATRLSLKAVRQTIARIESQGPLIPVRYEREAHQSEPRLFLASRERRKLPLSPDRCAAGTRHD